MRTILVAGLVEHRARRNIGNVSRASQWRSHRRSCDRPRDAGPVGSLSMAQSQLPIGDGAAMAVIGDGAAADGGDGEHTPLRRLDSSDLADGVFAHAAYR